MLIKAKDALKSTFVGRLFEIWKLNKFVLKKNDNSYGGEYDAINNLVLKLGLNNGIVVDIAASDGYSQSSTLGFFSKPGWSGLAVEMDPIKFSKLSFLYSNFENAKLARSKVTPNNVKDLFCAFEMPCDITVLNLDIDSYDLSIIESILKSNYKPIIISMEINEKIPPGIFFTVDYDEKHYWREDNFFGCSIDAAVDIIKPHGYILYALEYNNALFIRKDCIVDGMRDLTSCEAYTSGYRSKSDRLVLFPWNAEIDEWFFLDKQELIVKIQEYFSIYKGKFTLKISDN